MTPTNSSSPLNWRVVQTADGSPTLWDEAFQAHYHSLQGARSESWYVFLEAGGVEARLREGRPTRVLEIGLGTGLNFALTHTLAAQHAAHLTYTALEARPLPPEVLDAYHQAAGTPPEIVNALLELPKVGPLDLTHLDFQVGDVQELAMHLPPSAFDAVYYDAFAPKHAPAMWTDSVLARTATSLAPGGILATFSVTGRVRRYLESLGLHVDILPGFGTKREMLRAQRPG